MFTSTYPIRPTIAVADLDRAKAWYADKLDLHPSREDDGGAMYDVAGGQFMLFPTPAAGTAQNTVAGWMVDDVDLAAKQLRERGVDLLTFDADGIEWNDGIAQMPTGEKALWFTDSEGNTLGVSNRTD